MVFTIRARNGDREDQVCVEVCWEFVQKFGIKLQWRESRKSRTMNKCIHLWWFWMKRIPSLVCLRQWTVLMHGLNVTRLNLQFLAFRLAKCLISRWEDAVSTRCSSVWIFLNLNCFWSEFWFYEGRDVVKDISLQGVEVSGDYCEACDSFAWTFGFHSSGEAVVTFWRNCSDWLSL